jgi:hypothetical protein
LKPKVLLDCGAFSASKGKGTINLEKYISFIHKWKDNLENYFVLDVIYDGETTWKNQKIMEDAELTPLPIFHQGTDVKYLYRCMEYPYFGMGGVGGKGYSFKDIVMAHDKCWDIICDDKGYPKNKVHGFGITSPKVMLRFPFFSLDSTSWVINSRYGHVIIPRFSNGKPNYELLPQFISVCGVTRYTGDSISGRYIFNFSDSERERIINYIESKGLKFGKSEFKHEPLDYKLKENEQWAESKKIARGKRKVEIVVERGLTNNILDRDKCNAIYYLNLQNSLEYPRQYKKFGSDSILF